MHRRDTMPPMPCRALVPIVATLLLLGCSTPPTTIEQIGSRREVMVDGRTEPRMSVAEALSTPDMMGIGILADLEGAITILDGAAWVTRADDDGGLSVNGPTPVAGDEATLLTLVRVRSWTAHSLGAAANANTLRTMIDHTARLQGIDTSLPFPFVIEGELTAIDVLVSNGVEHDVAKRTTDTVAAEPWRWSTTAPVKGKIVGFFATSSGRVMSQRNFQLHAHAVLSLENGTFTAEVERFEVGRGATLRLPDVR
jgi:alpha-acetolactate decarboxylase